MKVRYLNTNKVKEIVDHMAINLFLMESNAIEGVHDDNSLKTALEAWQYLHEKEELDDLVVKKMHYLIMRQHLLKSGECGYYRQIPVYIGGREAPSHNLVQGLMSQWFIMCNAAVGLEYPEEMIRKLHIQFEHIHPFVDGNGRTGRMLMNWQRLKVGLPLLIIEEKVKYEYYKWFN